MIRYIARRLLMIIPVLIGVTFIVFSLTYISPGDPARMILPQDATDEDVAYMRHLMGLDEPFLVQYFHFLFGFESPSEDSSFSYKGLIALDLGRSYVSNRPVFKTIPRTLSEYRSAVTIGAHSLHHTVHPRRHNLRHAPVFALGHGCLDTFSPRALNASLLARHDTDMDFFGKFENFSLAGKPERLEITSASGHHFGHYEYSGSGADDEVVYAGDYPPGLYPDGQGKGARRKKVIRKHALNNALIPIVTVIGLQTGQLLVGAVLTETVFSYPGIGTIMVDAIQRKDTPQILASVVFVAIVFALVNLIVDIVYAFIDPRIKAQYEGIKKRKPTAVQ